MVNRSKLSKIGIGTWGIGGFATKNSDNNDFDQIEALSTAIQKGLNYIEISMWAAEGYCAYILSEAIKDSRVNRENLFITYVGYPYNINSLNELETELDKFLKLINSDYVNSFQSSSSTYSKFGQKPTDEFVRKLLDKGKSYYTSFTNGNLEMIKKYKESFQDKLIAHEVCFNFEIRINEDLGILDFARKSNILSVIYQPLRRNRTMLKNWPLLVELSKKYNKTQNQIILNWIVNKGFLPLVKTSNLKHLKENLSSLKFNIDPLDLKKLNEFRPPNWNVPNVDWTRTGDGKLDGNGIYIDQLSNIFDEEYEKQLNKNGVNSARI